MSTPAQLEKYRKEFEILAFGFDLERNTGGGYVSRFVESRWQVYVWNMSLESLCLGHS